MRAAACPRKVMLLADGGYRVTWACGSVRVVDEGSGEWDAVDMVVLGSLVDDLPQHHHHAHVPHRAKVSVRR